MTSSQSFALPQKPLQSTSASQNRGSTFVLSGGIRLGGPALRACSLPSPPASPASSPSSSRTIVNITSQNVKVLTPHEKGLIWSNAPSKQKLSGNNGLTGRGNVQDDVGRIGSQGVSDNPFVVSNDHQKALSTLGKRKIADNSFTQPFLPLYARSDRAASTFSVATSQADIKPHLPVPMLPLPFPSKRFKKSASSKAVLIPVEQLPVYPLPPPPPIRDAALAKQVFIHSSCFPKSRSKFEDSAGKPTEHYEKLEHVGDSILGMVVTAWLHETKPGLTCGTASKLKAHLVSNATLSHISGMYNFPQKLQGDPHILPVLRAQTDVRAAMVEAYIAALYFSFPVEARLGEGIRVIDAWLREMYEPLFDFFYEYMKSEYEQHHLTLSSTLSGGSHVYTEDEIAHIDSSSQGMANLMKMYCYRQDRELHFEEERYETHCGILWRLKCLVDGIEVGEATRSGRKVAKNVAAWEACRRLGLVKEGDGETAGEVAVKSASDGAEASGEIVIEDEESQ